MRSRSSLIIDQIGRNYLMSLPFIRDWRTKKGRTANKYQEIESRHLDRYAFEPFSLLTDYAGEQSLQDAVIVEIGPGDHIPVALLCLGAGAERYISCDRFAGDIGGSAARQLYGQLMAIIRKFTPAYHERLVAMGIDGERFPESAGERVATLAGPIESISGKLAGTADIVFSYNVVEHIYDIRQFAINTWKMLKPGGIALHKVDYGPHDVWINRDNSLEWLTVPDTIWQMMGSNRGTPNRLRHVEVVGMLDNAGFEVHPEVSEEFSSADLHSIRAELAPRFRQMPDSALLVKTAVLLCRKPV